MVVLKDFLQAAARRMGFRVVSANSIAALADNLIARRTELPYDSLGLNHHEIDLYNYFISKRETLSLSNSRSQLGQDIWAAFLLRSFEAYTNGSSKGFFVEFGALDGKLHSNTYFFEKEFGWLGILAEPNPAQFRNCQQNRSCSVDNRCVWSTSGERLEFNVVQGMDELSTLQGFEDRDLHARERLARSETITVETVSLLDLLRTYQAPSSVDYISIDTEGSEFEILEGFSFETYFVKILSVEHNFGPQRDKISKLLERRGFFRLSRTGDNFDDMYLNADCFDKRILG